MGKTFYLIEKITSPTHYTNFALLISSIPRYVFTNSYCFLFNPVIQ
jgi:hypothetical protein